MRKTRSTSYVNDFGNSHTVFGLRGHALVVANNVPGLPGFFSPPNSFYVKF